MEGHPDFQNPIVPLGYVHRPVGPCRSEPQAYGVPEVARPEDLIVDLLDLFRHLHSHVVGRAARLHIGVEAL